MESSLTLQTKLPTHGISVFSQIASLAAEYNAVNLWQGAPNYLPDQHLIDAATAAMEAGFNQYSSMTGVAKLRSTLTAKIRTLYGASYDSESEITITAGGSEAIYAAIAALVHPGEEVIFFEPAFEVYEPVVRLQGARPVAIKLQLDKGFRVDWNVVAAAVTSRTRMIIINSPHNPTGTVFAEEDMAALAAITRDTNIVILSDEVYEHVIFDGFEHHSICRYPELAERSVVVFSLGKTYHVTGWRVGYCVAPARLTSEIRKIHQYLVFSAPTPLQTALASEVSKPESYERLRGFYEKKRSILTDALTGSRLRLLPSHGSFFVLAAFDHFSDLTDIEFSRKILVEKAVGTIPLSAFYGDGTETGMIRLSFCKDDDTLHEGGHRLSSL